MLQQSVYGLTVRPLPLKMPLISVSSFLTRLKSTSAISPWRWDSCSCEDRELWTSSFKKSSASYPLIASDREWSFDKSWRVSRMCPLKVKCFSHKKVTVSLPSANSNKKIKSNGTKSHFVFLLLTSLEAKSRKWRKRQVRSSLSPVNL